MTFFVHFYSVTWIKGNRILRDEYEEPFRKKITKEVADTL